MKRNILFASLLAVGAALAPTHAWSATKLVAGWDFEQVEADGVTIKSKVGTAVGKIVNGAILTDATGGRPGPGGGKGFDVSAANPGWLQVSDEDGATAVLAEAAANDQMSVVLWQKNNSNINSSSFWSASDLNNRFFQFHIPWSDGTIYFDTAGGCCAVPGQRLNLNVVATIPDYDWLAWHHYAFVKDGGAKRVYIDGNLFMSQDSGADPLNVEGATFRFTVGGADNASPPDAVQDDVAIYQGALSENDIKALAAGGSPFTPPLDTDGDGMPDDWETLYGFNKNDPSDATKDCDNDGVNNLNEYKNGTNPCDTTPPTLLSAVSTGTFDTVILTFSEAIDRNPDGTLGTNATVVSHYSISPALAITAAVPKKNTVTLTTAQQTPGGTAYTVTVNGVLDGSKNPVPTDSKATFYSYIIVTNGIMKFSYWGNIPTVNVQALLDDPRYPASPDFTAAATAFDSRTVFPDDSHENYGATMEGILTPTETADYDFFLKSDDASQLYISTDATEAGLVLQAEETDCCDGYYEPGADAATTAAPIHLVAGTKYFVRGILKEGGGGDYIQVAWRKTTDTTPAAALQQIPGRFFTSSAPAPAEGKFNSISPAPNDKNAFPGLVQVVHTDGKTVLDTSNVSLDVDGIMVQAAIEKVGNRLTVTYVPKPIFASASVHTAAFHYKDPGGNAATLSWTFTVFAYSGPTKDAVKSYPALIRGSAVYTANAGGHTGNAGDYGIDLTAKGGPVVVLDTDFLFAVNQATAQDELSVSFWAKHRDLADSSAFDFNSPSTGNQRAFHAHVPWDDGHIYFDTVGCCDGATQRIQTGINMLPGYDGADLDGDGTPDSNDVAWWTNKWHFFTFTKKAADKHIWVDGKLLLQGDSTAQLPTDVNLLYMGADGGGGGLYHQRIDDFATYSKELVEADVMALFTGTLPTALPASKGLIAYWPFNDAPAGAPTLTFVRSGGGFTITYTGTLESTATLGSGWAPVAGASPPSYTVTPSAAGAYYRSKQ